MTTYTIESIPNCRATVGEGSHWDADTQSLYFVDAINTNSPLYRYDYVENKTYSAKLIVAPGTKEPRHTIIIPVDGEPGHFVVTINNELGVIEWNGVSTEAKLVRMIHTVNENVDLRGKMINDAKVDPRGRLFFGTLLDSLDIPLLFKSPVGKLFRLEKDECAALCDGIRISNGLTWNTLSNKFYYIDSAKCDVMEFDYDPNTGDISNGKVLIDFPSDNDIPNFFPDGMTIDRDGYIYVTLFEGSKVVKINPKTGKVEQEINIPADQVTSVTFGGPNLDILFVTTGTWNIMGEKPFPAGSVFKVTGVGVGLPMNKARV